MPEYRPSDPVQDQTVARLTDLQRLRDLTHPYSTSPHADIRETLARMPTAERAEAEDIISRLGDIDSTRQQHRQKILLDLARMEPYLDQLAKNPANAEEVGRLRGEVERLRSQLTGLPGDPDGQQP
jgi:hypothetical protein